MRADLSEETAFKTRSALVQRYHPCCSPPLLPTHAHHRHDRHFFRRRGNLKIFSEEKRLGMETGEWRRFIEDPATTQSPPEVVPAHLSALSASLQTLLGAL